MATASEKEVKKDSEYMRKTNEIRNSSFGITPNLSFAAPSELGSEFQESSSNQRNLIYPRAIRSEVVSLSVEQKGRTRDGDCFIERGKYNSEYMRKTYEIRISSFGIERPMLRNPKNYLGIINNY